MESNKPANASDEIDIIQIFRSIGSGLVRFGNSMILGIAGLRSLFLSNLIYFSIIIAGSLVITVIYSKFLEKKYYTSSMIISCQYLNTRIVDNTIDKLNLLCGERDREGLSELLKVDLTTAKNIIEFKAEPFVSEDDIVETEVLKEQLTSVVAEKKDMVTKIMQKIDIENKHSFLINVKVSNPEIVKQLDSAIVRYFKSNEYIKKRIESNEASLISKKKKLIRESLKLDSLKAILFVNFKNQGKQSREGSNNVVLSDKYLTDPLTVFKEDLNLSNEIRAIDAELYLKSDFEVIDGLTTFKEPDNIGIVKKIVLSLLIAMVLGYLILGLLKFNQFLATFDH